MKLNKINFKNNTGKLLDLKLFKTNMFSAKKVNTIKIESIQLHLKNFFYIINKFHLCNKKILFIGTCLEESKCLKFLLMKSRHIFLPGSVWKNGAISNSLAITKHLFKRHQFNTSEKQKLDSLFNITNNYNLIVILDEKSIDSSILKESLAKRVPMISLNCKDPALTSFSATYKVLGNLTSKYKNSRNNIIYSGLNSIFKKHEKKIGYSKTSSHKNFKRK
jgi:hypothetical protein